MGRGSVRVAGGGRRATSPCRGWLWRRRGYAARRTRWSTEWAGENGQRLA
uniref:Uncharacterized protein n=1 Tax=uncultured bacterium A1Q1_fos_479 TaxID=1256575 RepID=L7VYT1_9BACT|nr:hypothetical protein [uncultured bacterium A1Q1_fos_479]